MTNLADSIPLGEYVFLRILQANPTLKSIFGVPGDYNLNLMEYLYAESVTEKGVKFVGNCNELNAAYTADGYARIIDTFSVLITTLGVGELSALNGVSSAFSEFVPVLHIVGSIPTFKEKHNEQSTIDASQNWHHLVQDKDQLSKPDVHVFLKMSNPISICTESLTYEGLHNGDNFDKIDNVIRSIYRESRPGYLYIPADLPDVKVSSERLRQPFNYKELDETNVQSKQNLNELTSNILSHLYESNSPSFMSDDLLYKFHGYENFTNIISKVANNKFVKLYSSRIAKYIDEDLDNFIGMYPCANEKVVDSFQNDTDLLIIFGYVNFETKSFYNGIDHFKNIKNVILINSDYVKINDDYYFIKSRKSQIREFSMNDLFKSIADNLDISKLKQIDNVLKYQYEKTIILPDNDTDEKRVSQIKLFNLLNSNIQENDIILSEISSFSFDLPNIHVKKNVRFIYNSYYASIGYALPATLGVSIALKDLNITNRRVILFEGDGSAQMTAQELSTYLRFNVTRPQIFIMNNEGYTIERAIKGETRSYNDIQIWNWEYAGKMFGDVNGDKHQYVKISNTKDFNSFFGDRNGFNKKDDKLEIIDLHMYKTDYSNGLKFFLGK